VRERDVYAVAEVEDDDVPGQQPRPTESLAQETLKPHEADGVLG
jgi:hypothetical protein